MRKEEYSFSLTPDQASVLRRCGVGKMFKDLARETETLPVTIKAALGGSLHGVEDEMWRQRFWDVELDVLEIYLDKDSAIHLVARFKPFGSAVIVTDTEPTLTKKDIKDFQRAFKARWWRISRYNREGTAIGFNNITSRPFDIEMVGETLGIVRDPKS